MYGINLYVIICSTFSPELTYSMSHIFQRFLVRRNTANVTAGKPIAVWSFSSVCCVLRHLCKQERGAFSFVSDAISFHITAWPRDIRRCEYSRGANGEASSDWNKCIAMHLSSHAQRRTVVRPATETKEWMSKEHATQLSTARRLAVRGAGLRGQLVRAPILLKKVSIALLYK
jgi:hypothetical protein